MHRLFVTYQQTTSTCVGLSVNAQLLPTYVQEQTIVNRVYIHPR